MIVTYSALFNLGANTYEWQHKSPERLSNQQLATRFINYLTARGFNLERCEDVQICDDEGWPLIGCNSAAMLASALPGLSPFPTDPAAPSTSVQ